MTSQLRVGIACFPTFGGSGIVATEIGLELARRGHQVHLFSARPPWRLDGAPSNVLLHEVVPRGYPLFAQGEYTLALTSKLVEVAQRQRFDLFHMHYAVPHATAGYLAQQVLGDAAPKMVTTLHGTDATLVGSDPSYLPVTRFSIERSDAVTVPSVSLRESTFTALGVATSTAVDVIPNFVDTAAFAPATTRPTVPVLLHSSNFRPLKRVLDVLRIFAEVRRQRPCTLVMIGDGPDRPAAEQFARQLALGDVEFMGEQVSVAEVMKRGRVFLLPSESESFGLAALEAMSCGVPVVASNVGGLPEVVTAGETGFLLDVGDIAGMAEAVRRLIDDDGLHRQFSERARRMAVERFDRAATVDRYEALYRRILRA